jgi:hypothetical protein
MLCTTAATKPPTTRPAIIIVNLLVNFVDFFSFGLFAYVDNVVRFIWIIRLIVCSLTNLF